MFDFKKLVLSYTDIPNTWIFENYLNVEPLSGQTVIIKSVLNPNERTPSMSIYYNRKLEDYRYKCFSTGEGGNGIGLMMKLWNCGFTEAFRQLEKDYNSNKHSYVKNIDYKPEFWQASNEVFRGWNTDDAEYWGQFNISSSSLEHHCIKPISSYTMSKIKDKNLITAFNVQGRHMYGFYTKKGKLYKIYRPKQKPKFLKLETHIQGVEQLKKHDGLLICSSLKDIMTIKSLGLRVDCIAPDSENTMICPATMEKLIKEYKFIATFFDSDKAGIEAMEKYNKMYNLPFIYLPIAKDVSDAIFLKGKIFLLHDLVPKISKAFDKYTLAKK